jgi:hypothetical protein
MPVIPTEPSEISVRPFLTTPCALLTKFIFFRMAASMLGCTTTLNSSFSFVNNCRVVSASVFVHIRSCSRCTWVTFDATPQRCLSANEPNSSASQCLRWSYTVSRCGACCSAIAFACQPAPNIVASARNDACASLVLFRRSPPTRSDLLPIAPVPSASFNYFTIPLYAKIILPKDLLVSA